MRRITALAALLLLAAAAPAGACISGPTDVAKGRVFMPDSHNSWTSPVGYMRAGGPAFLTLGLLGKGDRWELPGPEAHGPVTWTAEPRAEGGFTLWLSAGQGGQSALYLRYVFADGQSSPVHYILIVDPPPPPPRPWALTVDKPSHKDIAAGGRETILRMAMPPPAGQRWEVKEAAFFSYADKEWRSMAVEPIPGETNAFRFIPQGEKARIVLVEASDGWLQAPQTVNVELTVDSSRPKC